MRFPLLWSLVPSQTELPASTLVFKQEEERVRDDQAVLFLKTSSLCSSWRVQHFDPHFQDLPAFDRERWPRVGPASFTHSHAWENLLQWCANSFLAGWDAKQHLSQPVYHILAHFSAGDYLYFSSFLTVIVRGTEMFMQDYPKVNLWTVMRLLP